MEIVVEGCTVIVDECVRGLIEGGNLSVSIDGYVFINSKPLHRVLANAPRGVAVHHKNSNKLDNRRANLIRKSNNKHCADHRKAERQAFTEWARENLKTAATSKVARELYFSSTGKSFW